VLAQAREQLLDLFQVGDIGAVSDCFVADFLHRRAQGVGIAPGDDDPGALGCERFRRGQADATVAANNDGHSADETLYQNRPPRCGCIMESACAWLQSKRFC
jgi:hypothetical protein